MNFDSLLLAASCSELQHRILGAKVERVIQPDPLIVIIQLFKEGRKENLLVSASSRLPRIHLTTRYFAAPNTPPGFCMLLRKWLTGATLHSIDMPFGLGERVISFAFGRPQSESCRMVVEIMGKHSNIILLGENERILGAAKIVTDRISRLREIKTGAMYAPPPTMTKLKIDPYDPTAFYRILPETFETAVKAKAWIMDRFSGVSPLVAVETVARAGEAPFSSETLWYRLNDILNTVRLSEYAPVQYLQENGLPAAYPIRLVSIPAQMQKRWSSIGEAVDDATEKIERAQEYVDRKNALLAMLRRADKHVDAELANTRNGLENADKAAEFQEIGDLLMSSPNAEIVDGLTLAPDYYASEPDAKRRIVVDEALSIAENAQKYYRKAKKARDSKDLLTQRQDRLSAESNRLLLLLTRAEAAENLEDVALVEKEIAIASDSGKVGASPKSSTSEPGFEGHRIKRYRSPDGWEILVGENATSNDYLTTKIASPSDIWLHARSMTSAHAIIRAQNRPAAVSEGAIRMAAELVAKRSEAKHSKVAPVDFTLKKYVRKPRKSAPGMVTYSNEKTIDVSLDDD
jgi:predicted ribosome quality control (RQC) complex YloA/Tae2 family protein